MVAARHDATAVPLVYDVGMHNGDDTAYYLHQGCRVVAIEADPALAARGGERFAGELRDGRLTIVNVGIAEDEGERDFWICDERSEWNSFDRGVASRNGLPHHAVQVATRRFSSILAEFGVPHYLKIDIEGSDVLCLRDLDRTRLPTYVSCESESAHDAWAPTTDQALGPLQLLADLGYRRFKLIDQRTLAPLTVPFNVDHLADWAANAVQSSPGAPFRALRALGAVRAARRLRCRYRLGRRHGWHFADGCSGPWGEDTPGRWMTFGEGERTYRFFRGRHLRNPQARAYGFWCDWHATV